MGPWGIGFPLVSVKRWLRIYDSSAYSPAETKNIAKGKCWETLDSEALLKSDE